jgi:hypothetical protein
MARSTVTLTTSWQQLSSTKCVITVLRTKGFQIFFNETASDTNAISKIFEQGDQVQQSEVKDTYARVDSANADCQVVVVEEG